MNTMRKLFVVPMALLVAACSDDPIAVEERNIVEVASDAGSFTTLITAVQAAGLAGVLQGEGPFTVFAPTDQAFALLPAGTVQSLLANPTALANILTFHVVPGRVTAASIVSSGGAQPTTVQGQNLAITVANGIVRVNGARVTTADIPASNGIIHVIDAVLLP